MLITPSEFMDFISRVATLLYWLQFFAFLICVTAVVGFISPKGRCNSKINGYWRNNDISNPYNQYYFMRDLQEVTKAFFQMANVTASKGS